MSMKNSSDTIGHRTRDLPASSALSQTAAPPRTPYNCNKLHKGGGDHDDYDDDNDELSTVCMK
jgi:hypothetical protein